MTTVAYRAGVLVSESRATTGDFISDHNQKKLFELADGSCVASIGNVETAMILIDWMIAKADGETADAQPTLTKDKVDVIHLRADGTIWMTTNGKWFQCFGEYQAWGTGAAPACAVMAAGLDPLAAVLAACTVDPYSGGRPQWFALPEAKDRLKQAISKAKRKGQL